MGQIIRDIRVSGIDMDREVVTALGVSLDADTHNSPFGKEVQ